METEIIDFQRLIVEYTTFSAYEAMSKIHQVLVQSLFFLSKLIAVLFKYLNFCIKLIKNNIVK